MGLGCGYNRVWISVTTSIRFKSRVKAWIRFRVRARVRVEVRANFGLGLQPGLGLEILLVFKLGYLRLGLGARLAFQTNIRARVRTIVAASQVCTSRNLESGARSRDQTPAFRCGTWTSYGHFNSRAKHSPKLTETSL